MLSAIVQNQELPVAIIVDIDGTVAKMNGRGPYDLRKVDTDLRKDDVCDLVFNLNEMGYNVIFMSGRDDSCREATLAWLDKNVISEYDIKGLHMRKTGDFRKDAVVKKELFDTHVKDKYYVQFCLDDRDQVVELWRSMGLTCLQVDYGNF